MQGTEKRHEQAVPTTINPKRNLASEDEAPLTPKALANTMAALVPKLPHQTMRKYQGRPPNNHKCTFHINM